MDIVNNFNEYFEKKQPEPLPETEKHPEKHPEEVSE